MENPYPDAPEGAIAVYNDRQARVLRGEVFGIAMGMLIALATVVALSVYLRTDILRAGQPVYRGEYAYNYAGVQKVNVSDYQKANNIKPNPISAAALTAYNTWLAANPNTVNVQVLNKYLGADYTKTSSMFNYMSAYVSTGVGESCEYCHNLQNFSDYTVPQKTTAKNMLIMQFETQNKWVNSIPRPQGQPLYQLTCATCHVGQAKGWNTVLKLKSPEKFGIAGSGNPYNYEFVDKQYLDTRADAQGNINYFKVTATEKLPKNNVGLSATERNQYAMYHQSAALNVGCDFCHYGGYFPSYVLEDGTFKWPKAQARHMQGMVQDLAVNWWPQLQFPAGADPAAQPNCYMCHRGNVVPPGASLDAPKPVAVAAPDIRPLVDLKIPKSVVPAGK